MRDDHLADALQAHPRVFSRIYVNMVRAGEESGTLETVLARLADYNESQARLLRTVQSALTYPVMMIVVSVVILIFLLAYVVPQVTRIFTETGRPLPLATRILLSCSSFFAAYWWVMLLALAVERLSLHGSCGRQRTRVVRSDAVTTAVGRASVSACERCSFFPYIKYVIGKRGSDLDSTRYCDTFTQKLRVSASGRRGPAECTGRGEFGRTVATEWIFPALLTQMMAVGERSGELESMLARAADAYDEEVTVALARLTSLLEP